MWRLSLHKWQATLTGPFCSPISSDFQQLFSTLSWSHIVTSWTSKHWWKTVLPNKGKPYLTWFFLPDLVQPVLTRQIVQKLMQSMATRPNQTHWSQRKPYLTLYLLSYPLPIYLSSPLPLPKLSSRYFIFSSPEHVFCPHTSVIDRESLEEGR